MKFIEYLKSCEYYMYNISITFVVKYNRLDLLEIIYRETNDFLKNDVVIDEAAKYGNLEAVKFLTELGASCSKAAMDGAAEYYHLDVVKYLHLNRSEGCDWALEIASIKGHFEIVKYLVENGLGIHLKERAIEAAKYLGKLEIVKYLEDHLITED